MSKIFKEKFDRVPAIELGLSSDTFLADQISELETKTFITNSRNSIGVVSDNYNKDCNINFTKMIQSFS